MARRRSSLPMWRPYLPFREVVDVVSFPSPLPPSYQLVRYPTPIPAGGTVTSRTYFRQTPRGLVLERIEASVPGMAVTSRVTLELIDVEGVLLPSRIVAFTARPSPLAPGTHSGGTSLTFLLTRYHVRKG